MAFFNELLRQVQALPGVRGAAGSTALPVNAVRFSMALPDGQPVVPLAERPIFNIQQVTPGYAAAMRIPLRHGREFTERDDANAPRVVMVNETLARRYWPNENPVGKHILLGRQPAPSEIVGVLGDVPNLAVGTDPQAEIYVPFAQLPSATQNLIVRTAGDPRGLTAAVRARVLALDRDQPVTGVQSMDEVLETGAAQPRFTTYLLGGLSATAFLLSMVGIYGVIAYSVAERTQEMGIRIALGADGRDILRLVLGHGLLLAGTGIAIGLAAAFALTRLMSSLLYHVSVTDPATFIAGPALFAAVALAGELSSGAAGDARGPGDRVAGGVRRAPVWRISITASLTLKEMKSRAPKNFSYSVYYEQAPEGGYVAFVPALPGCHTQGETLEEAERNVKEAIASVPGKPGGTWRSNSRRASIVPGQGYRSRLIMAKLPSLTARKVVRALKRAGFVEDRQRGSHLMLIHPETKATNSGAGSSR